MSKPKPSRTGTFVLIRNRIIAGLFVVLPLFITFMVIKWLYDTLYFYLLQPIAFFLRSAWHLENEPSWILNALLSLAALGMVLGFLFVAGMFFRSRLHRTVDWALKNVPGVKTVYSAVSKVFDAFSGSADGRGDFKRVVLVQFPHAGMKAPAFVTGESRDIQTGKTILAVYVPTTPVPSSGYMLLVAQEDVVELNWDLEDTLQAIVSGGITVPKTISYYAGPSTHVATTHEPT